MIVGVDYDERYPVYDVQSKEEYLGTTGRLIDLTKEELIRLENMWIEFYSCQNLLEKLYQAARKHV